MTCELSTPAEVAAMVEGLARVAVVQRAQGVFPPLYRSHVTYRREGRGVDSWETLREVYARGWGDCKELTAIRLAELWAAGVQARPYVYRSAPGLQHCVVLRGGKIEDPSRRLGMKGAG